jgi:superfamily II DNA or RNA helicase
MPMTVDPLAHTPFSYEYNPQSLLTPYAYQQQLIDALVASVSIARSGDCLLIVLATGGGKNLVSNEFVANVIQEGKRVLRLTMNWELSAQCAADLCARHEGVAARVSYVGSGAAARAMNGLTKGAMGQVVYTTVHTWSARKNDDFADQHFDYVVIDEVHWGEQAPLYDAVLERYSSEAVFIGLTATPRKWTQFEQVGQAFDLAALVRMGILPRPVLHRVPTDVDWSPRRASEHGDVTPSSLSELGAHMSRDEIIVRTYIDGRSTYSRAIAFAVNIAHAERLAKCFVTSGVRAAALHSKMKHEARAQVVADFRAGNLDVLVNVVALIHGFDVPEVNTVLMARPTMSDLLIQQMLGRAARRAPGKEEFHVVDFVDNVTLHGVPVLRPDGFLGTRVLQPGARGPALVEHEFVETAIEEFPGLEGYEVLAGLPLQPQQTFGIEFELTALEGDPFANMRTWQQKADRLLAALRPVVPTANRIAERGSKDNSVWNVESDGSCGWEITSRILLSFEGYMEITDACTAIQKAADELGLGVSVKTGTHVHLGWGQELSRLRGLMDIAGYFEPAFVSLVGPSRAKSMYATPVRRTLRALRNLASLEDWSRYFRDYGRRYLAVNPRNLFHGYGTVEVRLHSGTIEAPKILAWTSLWMLAMAAARRGVPVPGDGARRLRTAPLCIGPRGDVRALAAYLRASSHFTERLVVRRDHVVREWWARNPAYTALAGRVQASWATTPNAEAAE